MQPELLIATNGYKGTLPAIEYGVWLAATLQMKVTLLGVTEKLNPAAIDEHHPLEEIEQPIFYVPVAKLPLNKVLICIGGLGYEVNAEHIAMQMAMKCRAEITFLHIIPPIDMNYPTAKTVSEHWQNLAETDTPVGRSQ